MCGGWVGNALNLRKDAPALVMGPDPAVEAQKAEAAAAIKANTERVAKANRRRQQSLLAQGAPTASGGELTVLGQYGKQQLGA